MKKLCIYMLFFSVIALTGCYDREIIDAKPGESIDPVENLQYAVDGTEILFSWNMPGSYPDDIITPVSVAITVFQDNMETESYIISDDPTSYTYFGYDSQVAYRFIFKVMADVDTEDLNKSKLRYSEGVIASI